MISWCPGIVTRAPLSTHEPVRRQYSGDSPMASILSKGGREDAPSRMELSPSREKKAANLDATKTALDVASATASQAMHVSENVQR